MQFLFNKVYSIVMVWTLTWEGIEFGNLILLLFIIEISLLKILCRRRLWGVIS